MRSARRLYRLNLLLAIFAAAAVLLGLGAALTRFDTALPSAAALAAACRSVIPIQSVLATLLVTGLATLAVVVVARAARSARRQHVAQRRFLSAVARLRSIDVAGESVSVVDDRLPRAFCSGLLRPRIYVSNAAVDALSADELRAVVAHEAHHCRRREPLRIFSIRLLADALFFVPALRRLGDRYRELAELAADEAATGSVGPEALAGALLSFREPPDGSRAAIGIASERVDCLLGEEPRWRLPPSILGGAIVGIAALLASAAALPAVVRPGAVSPATLLAEACMVAMFAGPVAVIILAASFSWRRLRRAEA